MEAISSSSAVLLSSAGSGFLCVPLKNPGALCLRTSSRDSGSGVMSVVECSSRPRKKCTAHHNKTRPKKHNPSDKNRKPAVYPRLPKPPPVVSLGWVDPPPLIDNKKRKLKPSKLDDWLELVTSPAS